MMQLTTPALETSRLTLVPLTLEVGRAVGERRAEAEAAVGARIPPEWPSDSLREFLPDYLTQLESDPDLLGWGIWLIIERSTATMVGDLGFKGRADDTGTIDLGYLVFGASRGQGYATEAAAALCDWAAAQPGVTRIVAVCHPENAASRQVLQKIGMRIAVESEQSLLWERTID
jgi:ribosomal-protein-alanine N-acetyltransferase